MKRSTFLLIHRILHNFKIDRRDALRLCDALNRFQMLLNDLCFLQSVSDTEGGATFHILLKDDHPLYKGHFPGQPVTPGVVLVEIVKELLENHLDKSLDMTSMRQCKFLSAHNPVQNPQVAISASWTSGDEYTVHAVGSSQSEVFFKLSACYREV